MPSCFLNTSKDGDSNTSLSSPFQFLTILSVKKSFTMSSLNLPWDSLRTFYLVLSLMTWEESGPHLATTSFQVVLEHNKKPEPPFPQDKQPQLHGPSLEPLQHLTVCFGVRSPEMDTGLEVQPHQC